MKIINIILLVLIVIGFGLLFTQKLWVPQVVNMLLTDEEKAEITQTLQASSTPPYVQGDGMESWNWVSSEVSPEGLQFIYPHPLPTKFISAREWPPRVELVAEDSTCEVGIGVADNGSPASITKKTIFDKEYCVSVSSEGAAGSTYTTYKYKTIHDDYLAEVSFTLRTPQCLNYDEPERSACQVEQGSFYIDALVYRITSSIRRN